MKVIGFNLGHNASLAVLDDGKLVEYLEEERLSRVKRAEKIDFLLDYVLDKYEDISHAVLTQAYYSHTRERHFANIKYRFAVINRLKSQGIVVVDYTNCHHLCHASNAYFGSGFDEAVCVVMDGKGSVVKHNNIKYSEIESIYHCKDGKISEVFKHYSTFAGLKECKEHTAKFGNLPVFEGHKIYSDRFSIGQSFRTVSSYCGFDEPEGGKTMGLSTYGKESGSSLWEYVNGHYFATTQLYPRNDSGWGKYYGEEVVKEDLAYNVQKCGEEAALNMVRKAVELTGCNNVVVSGGFFMNCVSNYNIVRNLDVNLYVDPTCYDGGTAIGAAMLAFKKRIQLNTLYLGPTYDLSHIEGEDVTYDDIAKLISENNIVAMYQGRSEAGPRALGNRSILYNPCDPNGRDHVNIIKRREAFRPFAGTVLQHCADEWFDMQGLVESPFMMYAVDALPHTYDKIPAILHVDKTCRVQTVTKKQNEHYYNLIAAFQQITGVPILFNTSFNLAGEPLVETPEDAFRTLDNSDIQYLYFPEVGKLVRK